MREWIEAVTDRNRIDIMNRTPNAYLNASDLNRIGGNLRYVRELLRELGRNAPMITCRDDWEMSDVPRESDIGKIKTDVTALRALALLLPDTPLTPDLPYTHYQKLNDIERILSDIHAFIQRVHKSFIGTNEIGCGELQ